MDFSNLRGALVVSGIAFVTACGGGGGGGAAGGASGSGIDGGATTVAIVPATPDVVTVDGVVAKGPAKGAKVFVYATDSNGKKGPILQTVQTGAGGTYSVSIPKQTGTVLIEADLEGADIDDETAPGTTTKGKAGEKMLCALSLAAGAKTTANVTPFSDMAAAMASSRGGANTYSAADVASANRKIRDLTIDDHLTASPTGALKSKLTTVALFVKKSHGGDLTAALAELRGAAKFDAGKNGFVVTGAVSQKLATACEGADCSTQSNFGNATLAETAVAPGNETSAVDAVKALFQDLLDTVQAYRNADSTGEIQSVGDKLRNAVESAAEFMDDEALGVLAAVPRGYELFSKKTGPTTPIVTINSVSNSPYAIPGGTVFGQVATKFSNGQTVTPGLLPMYGCELAVATTLTTAGGDLDVATYAVATTTTPTADINAFACYGIGTSGRLLGNALDDSFSRNHSITVLPQADGSFKYVHQTRKINFDRTITPTSVRDGLAQFGTMTRAVNGTGQVARFTFQGQISPGFKFLKTRTVAERAKFSHQVVNLSLDATYDPLLATGIYKDNSLDRLTLGGSIRLIKADGSEASSLTVANGSVLAARRTLVSTPQAPFYYFGGIACNLGGVPAFGSVSPNLTCAIARAPFTNVDADAKEMNLGITVAMPGAKFEGILKADGAGFDKSGNDYQPTAASFTGKVYEGDGAGGHRLLLEGRIAGGVTGFNQYSRALALSPTNYAARNVNFDGKVYLKSRPAIGLNLAFQEGAFNQGVTTGTFFWGGKSFTIRGNASTFTNAGTLEFLNSDGAKFDLASGSANSAVSLKKGSTEVGIINMQTKRIDYSDGSFQQY